MSGGGGGILPMLGTAALGIAAPELLGVMAPEFMASLGGAAPALIGGLTGGVSSGLTGGNPLTGALTGAAGGAASGFLDGLLGPNPSDPSQVASDVSTASAPGGTSQYAFDAAQQGGQQQQRGLNDILSGLTGNSTPGMPPSAETPPIPPSAIGNVAAPAAKSSGGVGNWISNNPLQAAGVGAGLLGAMFPTGMNPVNVGGNAASVQGTNPGFSASLPKYNYNSVQTPYTGDWYTYGQRPQKPMVQNTLTPMAEGGPVPERKPPVPPQMPPLKNLSVSDVIAALPKDVLGTARKPMFPDKGGDFLDHARGGMIRSYAKGGMSHQFKAGQALGQALRQHLQGSAGPVRGPGGGQDDLIPAKLSAGEFVVPADVTSMLGDGSTDAGGKKLQHMVHKVRAHKATKRFPPKAKNPLAYARA